MSSTTPFLVIIPAVLGVVFLPSVSKLYIAAVILIALLAQFLHRGYKVRSWFRGLPGPPHSLIFGHLKVMGEISAQLPPNCHLQIIQTAIAHKYNLPDLFYLDLWPIGPSFLVLGRPDLMNEVQVLKPEPMHHIVDKVLSPVLGPNVIPATNGALWKKLHNMMSPAFAWAHVRTLAPMIADECETFRQTLTQFAESGQTFSMEHKGAELIFDVISRLVFNYSLDAQKGGSHVLEDIHAMIAMTEGGLSVNPLVWIPVHLKRGTIKRRVARFLAQQVRTRYQLLKEDKIIPSRKDPSSVLDLMLREHMQQLQQEHSINKDRDLSKEEVALIVGNLKGLLVGGHGTTNDTMCFMFMLLSKNPDILAKLREEHNRVFSPDHEESVAILNESPHKLSELEYTQAVILETLRMFPVGTAVRAARPGRVFTLNGNTYPLDNDVAISAASHWMQYNPKYFPSPDEFDPSRYLDPETGSAAKQNMRSFSRGSRACLGQNLAQDELKVILLMVVREFEFECVGEYFEPNKVPRMPFSSLDTLYGDAFFQERGIEAKPRGGMMMKVRKVRK